MRVYIAARYDRRSEMNGYADWLRGIGFIVNCRWLTGSHQLHPGAEQLDKPSGFENQPDGITVLARPFAEDDLEDIRQADILVLFSESPELSQTKRGGRHVEFGIALGLGKLLVVIGPRENVFHCLEKVARFDTWTDSLSYWRVMTKRISGQKAREGRRK